MTTALPPYPWYGAAGWTVGRVPVTVWGSALEHPARLPRRWLAPPAGEGTIDPTDFELACYVHLCEHELARVRGRERLLLDGTCCACSPTPAGLDASAARGESLVPFCPGVSWFWPTETNEMPGRTYGPTPGR